MTKEEARDAALTAINAYADAIFAAQAARLASKGSYLQRVATHSVVPSDGTLSAPDQLALHPSDEPETGEEYFTFPSEMITCAKVDVSDGPDGKSFLCTFNFDWSAEGMRQQYQVKGPERHDFGWTEYDPDAAPFI